MEIVVHRHIFPQQETPAKTSKLTINLNPKGSASASDDQNRGIPVNCRKPRPTIDRQSPDLGRLVPCPVWDVDRATGRLLFLSNPDLPSRALERVADVVVRYRAAVHYQTRRTSFVAIGRHCDGQLEKINSLGAGSGDCLRRHRRRCCCNYSIWPRSERGGVRPTSALVDLAYLCARWFCRRIILSRLRH